MTLKQDPRCYTDVCVDGKWFHYDHCGTQAYMLKGGSSAVIELAKEPVTEGELVEMLQGIAK
ncbi:hypothetical protein AB4179_12505 [Vibrio lentus]|uniref:hypothetical protein n=1 Tax=Vibrio TaxID=662 RepID=UPI00030F8E2E|nr:MULTISPECIES: hypothetical protein [Vibrio]MCC4856878.1 hypothetical protein [Vibrio lentus]OED64304.1 hypothetical protein A165_11020 [Vibrio tasmaniensis ZS-17]OMO20617.1 hypothetical protein BH583_14755 [Vibrio lentus]PMH28191.1 hypothetical protein BCU71_06365 [Vibrio lentus]PMK70173.1 hypothetical protein BCT93_06000 [Vibrio lentus]